MDRIDIAQVEIRGGGVFCILIILFDWRHFEVEIAEKMRRCTLRGTLARRAVF